MLGTPSSPKKRSEETFGSCDTGLQLSPVHALHLDGHEPSIHLIRPNLAEEHEVPQDHEPLGVVCAGVWEDSVEDCVDRLDAS